MLVSSGWQADIPAGAGVETLMTPIAKNLDGSSITGPVMARFADMPVGSTTLPIIRGRMTGTAMPASLDTSKATLTQRASEGGSRVPIAASNWAFADCTRTPFPGHPDPEKLCLKSAFDPAFLYELAYIAKDPPVHGIGFAATRDLLAFLRRAHAANPLGASIRHTIAQGNSQSGNYLRSFLHLGFNQDERGRQRVRRHEPQYRRAAAGDEHPVRRAQAAQPSMFEPGSEGVLWWDDTPTPRGGVPRRAC